MYEVGYSWETTRGNIFTVIKKAQGFLFLHCNKCSLDTEMFPDGEFKISVSSVTPRSAPCGCGGKRMDARQHTLRAKRAAEAHGFVFEGWVEGVKPRPKGHIKLYNPRNGNRWETACAEGLERGFGCPIEGREKTLKTRGLTLEDFENNLKTKGKLKSHHTLFTKNEDLYLRCEVCSEDDFSKAGVGGDGVFKVKEHYYVIIYLVGVLKVVDIQKNRKSLVLNVL